MFQQEVRNGRKVVIITANKDQNGNVCGEYNSRLYVNCGETITFTVKRAKTLTGALKQAHKMVGLA